MGIVLPTMVFTALSDTAHAHLVSILSADDPTFSIAYPLVYLVNQFKCVSNNPKIPFPCTDT